MSKIPRMPSVAMRQNSAGSSSNSNGQRLEARREANHVPGSKSPLHPSASKGLTPQGTAYLERLADANDHFQAAAMVIAVEGKRPLTHYKRLAISVFEQVLRDLGPEIALKKEVSLNFHKVPRPDGGFDLAVTHAPIVGTPTSVRVGPRHPNHYMNIHSHPLESDPNNRHASVVDQLGIRRSRQRYPLNPYDLVRLPTGKYVAYDGGVPLRQYNLIDEGSGHRTPPRPNSPDGEIPPLPPERVFNLLRSRL